ncbi:MAG: 4Fe-4S dicluster domain-containing protein [Deltaproteobacteria bacterium]|nr:4Fe-4S dicluster domain-containing protein [Deltaproteobacteria bacterium]
MTQPRGRARPLTVEERLYADETRPDRASHLTIADPERCRECAGRECTVVCPAATYEWNAEETRVAVRFENCLECGACRLACPHANITWRYPMGGMGICYRYG